MTDPATTLSTLAAEFEGLVKAHAEQARMADANAKGPGMSPAMARAQIETADRFRQAANHFEARAKACQAGATALVQTGQAERNAA